MTQLEIEKTLIEMLKGLQAGTGEEPCEVTSATVPIKDLGYFDSLLALETTIVLEERLGRTFGEDSVFWDKETSEPLSVSQIAGRIARVPGAGE